MNYILGTAQLGSIYGINNIDGKPSKKAAFDILSAANNNGLSFLDTASAYGDSEKVIGEFIKETGNNFQICSKYFGNKNLSDELQQSLNTLSVHKLYLYYLHKYKDCLDNSIIESLVDFKKNGIIERIGVSVYAPDELCFIIENLRNIVDVVQIPFSVFDCARWIKPIKDAYSDGIEIYCRSIFLQGAIFKKPDDDFIVFHDSGEQLMFIQKLCEKYNCDMGNLAFSFCSSFQEISGILFGLENLSQLNQNLMMFKNSVKIAKSDKALILDKMYNINPKFIDPRTWKLRG